MIASFSACVVRTAPRIPVPSHPFLSIGCYEKPKSASPPPPSQAQEGRAHVSCVSRGHHAGSRSAGDFGACNQVSASPSPCHTGRGSARELESVQGLPPAPKLGAGRQRRSRAWMAHRAQLFTSVSRLVSTMPVHPSCTLETTLQKGRGLSQSMATE